MTTYRVSKEFTVDLGGRYRTDGDFSGEEFREDVVLELLDEALISREPVNFDFDGCTGLPTSFAEEAFGGAVRKRPKISADDFADLIRIDAPNTPGLWPYVEFARDAIKKALAKR